MTTDEQAEIQALRELVERLQRELRDSKATRADEGKASSVVMNTSDLWENSETGV